MRILLGCIASLIWAASCETVIEVDIPDAAPRLVVNSYLSTDSSAVSVDLTASASILSERS
ncbi:MAG: hypothetical protein AAFO69_19405, partial [Bacteroidota bacterium]